MFVQYNGNVQNQISTWLFPKFTRPEIKGVFGWLLCFGTVQYENGIIIKLIIIGHLHNELSSYLFIEVFLKNEYKLYEYEKLTLLIHLF